MLSSSALRVSNSSFEVFSVISRLVFPLWGNSSLVVGSRRRSSGVCFALSSNGSNSVKAWTTPSFEAPDVIAVVFASLLAVVTAFLLLFAPYLYGGLPAVFSFYVDSIMIVRMFLSLAAVLLKGYLAGFSGNS